MFATVEDKQKKRLITDLSLSNNLNTNDFLKVTRLLHLRPQSCPWRTTQISVARR